MLVKNVKFKDNRVEIIMDNGTFFISKENYIENPVTIDSYIDQKQIDSLIEKERKIAAKSNIIKTLNKKLLSKYNVIKKLKEYELNNKEIEEIITSLSRMGLLNDEYYTLLKVENLLVKRKGKLEIRKVLLEEKIDESIIDKCLKDIDNEMYINNFNKVKEKYLKMYSNKSYKMKEQMVKLKLKEYGYEEELISEIAITRDLNEETYIVRKEVSKLLKNNKDELLNSTIVNKIKLKLINKGFSYDIINMVLEEVQK